MQRIVAGCTVRRLKVLFRFLAAGGMIPLTGTSDAGTCVRIWRASTFSSTTPTSPPSKRLRVAKTLSGRCCSSAGSSARPCSRSERTTPHCRSISARPCNRSPSRTTHTCRRARPLPVAVPIRRRTTLIAVVSSAPPYSRFWRISAMAARGTPGFRGKSGPSRRRRHLPSRAAP